MISIGRPNFRLFLSFVIAIIVIVFALYYRSQLMQALSKISIGWTLVGLIIYLVNYALRALRLKLLSHNQIPWWPEGLYVAFAHGFATYIIPFRAGDLSLPVILRSVASLDLVEGGRMLIKARLLDVQALGLWILIAALTVDFSLPYSLRIVWLSSGIMLLSTPGIIKLFRNWNLFPHMKIVKKIRAFIKEEPPVRHTFLLSIGIWLGIAGFQFCAARAVGLNLNPMQIWLLITIQLPLQILPVQGVAGAGAHEGGWVAALIILGIPLSNAIEYSLTSHIVILFYVLSIGPLAILCNQFSNQKTS
jgi:hypothetical protein